jgi:hypothetical protein
MGWNPHCRGEAGSPDGTERLKAGLSILADGAQHDQSKGKHWEEMN